MSFKDYFDKATTIQALANKSAQEIGAEVESVGYHEQDIVREERFIPQVDYTLPGTFARYGLAEEYYDQALKRIYDEYPYDGSLEERVKWENESTYLDLHIFDKEYPRTNGYISFSPSGWGSLDGSLTSDGYGLPATVEYIALQGGPHPNPDGMSPYSTQFTGSNYYETAKNRENNLKYDLQNKGVTVEFWLKKAAFDPTKTEKEVIYDLYNGGTEETDDYGRLTIELSASAARVPSENGAGGLDPFLVTLFSGNVGIATASVCPATLTTASVADNSWHHYAFTFMSASTSTGVDVNFYIDGTLSKTTALTTVDPDGLKVGLNEVTGALQARIGALITSPTGSSAAASAGKLSASLDEFRYWKTERSGKNIGRHWFTQVGGGTNDDPTPYVDTTEVINTNLGVYYKFNEGITGVAATDAVVLDFSGRITNGTWTGYTAAGRSTGSAIVESSAAIKEFKDPIIYSFHPEVTALATRLQISGSNYDTNNNASIYNSIPSWMVEEDIEGQSEIKHLTQILSSYFDTLHLQVESLSKIQNVDYVSGSSKPYPFADRRLASQGLFAPNLFLDADVLEKLADRSEDRVYEKSLTDIKNTIYQNIYNNLVYIYKSKGTEKAFRNMIRCFGIDDELVKLNAYAGNLEYEVRDNRRIVSVAEKFIDFNTADNAAGTVFQFQNPGDTTNTSGYLPGNTELTGGYAQTLEVDVLFPLKPSEDSSTYVDTNVISSSLFGVHGAVDNEADTSWDFVRDASNFQVYAARDEITSDNARFTLTGTVGGFVPELQSPLFEDVYNNTHWNLAVRIKPEQYPWAGAVAGYSDNYTVELHGVQLDAGIIQNEFTVSGTIASPAAGFVSGSKRVYVGAHRTNFTGALLQASDVKIDACRYWLDYLDDKTLAGHAYDTQNYGSLNPHYYAFPFASASFGEVLQADTLVFNWEFSANTGSNASGQFRVADESSGSAAIANTRFGWAGDLLSKQYTSLGYNFATSSVKAVDKDFILSSKLQLPENVQSSDMVNVLSQQDQDVFTRDSRPVNYFFAFEKSMAQAVSVEMINYFATLKDINNIIGAPVNRYRPEYKGLKILRQRFFERVSNDVIDFDKFYEFYKWFDTSLSTMIQQLVPASADFAENVRTLIESHVLERSKYQHKFQNVKQQLNTIEGTAVGSQQTGEMSQSPEDDPQGTGFYSLNAFSRRQLGSSQPINFKSWNLIHAPVPVQSLSSSQDSKSIWWKSRATRGNLTLSSSEGTVNTNKQVMLNSIEKGNTRAQNSIYRFGAGGNRTFGGVGSAANKKVNFVFRATEPFGAGANVAAENVIIGSGSGVEQLINTTDEYHPAFKQRLGFDMDPDANRSGTDTNATDGNILAPFSIYSSSLDSAADSLVANNYATGTVITNLHHDLVYSSDIPAQGPFTEQFVGGRQFRHTPLNQSGSNGVDQPSNRAEGWKIEFQGVSSSATTAYQTPMLGIVAANYDATSSTFYDADIPTAHRLRNVGTKRPVNIQNIKMTTASAGTNLSGVLAHGAIGNYQKNYQVVQSNSRRKNDPYFNDQSFDFALHPETLATRGRFPLTFEPTLTITQQPVGYAPSSKYGLKFLNKGYGNNFNTNTACLTSSITPVELGRVEGNSAAGLLSASNVAISIWLSASENMCQYHGEGDVWTSGEHRTLFWYGGAYDGTLDNPGTHIYLKSGSTFADGVSDGPTLNLNVGRKGTAMSWQSEPGLFSTPGWHNVTVALDYGTAPGGWPEVNEYYDFLTGSNSGVYVNGVTASQGSYTVGVKPRLSSIREDLASIAIGSAIRQGYMREQWAMVSGTISSIAVWTGSIGGQNFDDVAPLLTGSNLTSSTLYSTGQPCGTPTSSVKYGTYAGTINYTLADGTSLYPYDHNYQTNMCLWYNFISSPPEAGDGMSGLSPHFFSTGQDIKLFPSSNRMVTSEAVWDQTIIGIGLGANDATAVGGTWDNTFLLDGVCTFPNEGGTLDYTLPSRTGSNSNQSIIVNRYAGSGYEVMSRGFMGPAHEEMSVYNALPYHNLHILDYGLSGSASVDPIAAKTITVVDQIDKNRGLDQRATLHCGPFGSDAAYGSVPASTYVTTPSWQKTNRNARTRMQSDLSLAPGVMPAESSYTASVYDNLYVQHQIPQSEQQYSWITASMAAGEVIYGLDAPACISSSTMSQLITASEYVLPSVGTNNVVNNFVGTVGRLVGSQADTEQHLLKTRAEGEPMSVGIGGSLYMSPNIPSSNGSYAGIGSASDWNNTIGGSSGGGDTKAFTLSAWIYFPSQPLTGDDKLGIVVFGDTDRSLYLIMPDAGQPDEWFVEFLIDGAGDGKVRSSVRISYDTWTHVLVTYDASNPAGSSANTKTAMEIFINGVLDTNRTTTSALTNPAVIATYPGQLGAQTGDTGEKTWDGYLAEFAVWDAALTAAQVLSVYGAGQPPNLNAVGPTSNLEAWYSPSRRDGDTPGSFANKAASPSYTFTGTGYDIELPLFYGPYSEIIGLNAFLNNQNGPYGRPTWKQIRAGETKVARSLRKQNLIGQIVPPPTLETDAGQIQGLQANTFVDYIEQPIASNAKPVFFAFEDNDANPDVANNLAMNVSYQNNLDYFSNEGLNNRLGVNSRRLVNVGTAFNTVADFTLSASLSTVIRYGERIYPAKTNAYQTRTRTRTEYSIADIWNDVRSLRNIGIDADGLTVSDASVWPLDAYSDAELASNGSGDRWYNASTHVLTRRFDGSGILQNGSTRFSGSSLSSIHPSPVYVFPQGAGSSHFSGITYTTTLANAAPFRAAGTSSNGGPYKPYAEYGKNIRLLGKDMSIVPEFRISEHIAEYHDDNNNNFLTKLDNIFTITGSAVSSSAGANFYKLYSTSDFMKYFKVVDDELADKTNGNSQPVRRHSIELSCDALLQFLPYKGFYPAERTAELGALLSQSLGQITIPQTPYAGGLRERVAKRILYEPLVSPGILFNTIKSGIACSSLIMLGTGSAYSNISNMAAAATSPFDFYQRNLDGTTCKIPTATASAPQLLIVQDEIGEVSQGYGIFGSTLPFEAIRNPDEYLGASSRPFSSTLTGSFLFDTGLMSSSLGNFSNASANIGYDAAGSRQKYVLAIDNFLCETVNFFQEPLKSFVSKPEEEFKSVKKDLYYGMEVMLSVPHSASDAGEYFVKKDSGMYGMESAFGPLIALTGTGVRGLDVFCPTAEPFLPPYWYGFAKASIVFKAPYSGKVTLDDILGNASIEYEKISADRQFHSTFHINPDYDPAGSSTRPQITSSVDINTKFVVVPPDTNTQQSRWLIQSKFETPTLDFGDTPANTVVTGTVGSPFEISDPLTVDANYPKPRGMWHQKGNRWQPDDGIFLSLNELPTVFTSDTYGTININSLADVVGMPVGRKRIGDFAEAKRIEEAIVCVPFLTEKGNRRFFDVDQDSQEYVTQLSLLNKYIFPPTFDFLTNQTVDPIAFYAFEFSTELSQDDLINIWQNLPPESNTEFQKKTATIKIQSLVSRLLDNDKDLQWMVFKVKRRAEKDYNVFTRKGLVDGLPIVEPAIDSPYSYNWPYDYFSLVELIKIDEDVVYATEDLIPEDNEGVPVVPDLREFIPAPEEMEFRISPGTRILTRGRGEDETATTSRSQNLRRGKKTTRKAPSSRKKRNKKR